MSSVFSGKAVAKGLSVLALLLASGCAIQGPVVQKQAPRVPGEYKHVGEALVCVTGDLEATLSKAPCFRIRSKSEDRSMDSSPSRKSLEIPAYPRRPVPVEIPPKKEELPTQWNTAAEPSPLSTPEPIQ